MKNVLIIGAARTGKTTLSKMLKDKYPNYNILHMDSIKNPIIRNIDKNIMNNVVVKNYLEYSDFMQNVLIQIYTSHIRGDKNNYGYIMEGAQLTPKIISENIDFKETIVIALGHGNFSKEDIFNLCKKYDDENSWSFNETDDNLKEFCKCWYDLNEMLKVECKKYNIEYIDTSKDREKTLKNIFDRICSEIN